MKIEQITGQDDSHILWLSNSIGIHKKMHQAWLNMAEAALKDGINLTIASGYRSFERQLLIWNRKFEGDSLVKNQQGQQIALKNLSDDDKITSIMLYSALPSTSRHHWGTDIDVYAKNLLPAGDKLQLEPWEYENQGPFSPLSVWLAKNSENFDFYLPYNKYRGGVAAEPWHLSFGPLASQCLKILSIEQVKIILGSADIKGKESIIEKLPDIFERYIYNTKHYDTTKEL